MIYLLLGEDSILKDHKIVELKKQLLPTQDALTLDYETLHASKLQSEDLKKALIMLPAVSKQRLVVIREAVKLSAHNQKLVLEFVKREEKKIVLILDSTSSDSSFVKKIQTFAKVLKFRQQVSQNIFDMTKAMSRSPAQALKILSELMERGDHPLRILATLIWFWGDIKGRLSRIKFEEGLLALREADVNIKRSRMRPEHAMETLVVRLSALIA